MTYSPSRNDIAWVALVVATLLTWFLGTSHDDEVGAAHAGVVVALVLAFAKAWIVGNEFMEIRHAPRWLRSVLAGWVLVAGSGLIGIYLLG
ncbi:MAG: cytochrome C oxidase subunit IV family protein [Solirubrobacteraceae bacterium]|nr:cytochrome C oxidase subunit IV family protein [Solirubrobacteraceae bacterium]